MCLLWLLQVSKTELLQVASTDFLAELGVVTQQQSKNKEGIVRGNVFFKITKYPPTLPLTCCITNTLCHVFGLQLLAHAIRLL